MYLVNDFFKYFYRGDYFFELDINFLRYDFLQQIYIKTISYYTTIVCYTSTAIPHCSILHNGMVVI